MNLYFDNASTSFPKPEDVQKRILEYLAHGGSYGRSAYKRVFETSYMVEQTRNVLAKVLGVKLSENIVFTSNSTTALNMLILGFKYKYNRVIISPLEHNAVIRPLKHLKQAKGLIVDTLPHFSDGSIDLTQLASLDLGKYDLAIVNHASNVNGLIQPLKELKKSIGNLPLLVDASQSLGKVTLDVDELNLDFVAFTGHKGLLGPTGTGGFYARNAELLNKTIFGGTGTNSESYLMPTSLPDGFEPGTPNVLGIYGLYGAIEGKPIVQYSHANFLKELKELQSVKGLRVLCAAHSAMQTDVFSVIPENGRVSDFAQQLNQLYGIEVRSGLHCAPLAHKTLGSMPNGSVRFSLSPYHTDSEITFLFNAIQSINERFR